MYKKSRVNWKSVNKNYPDYDINKKLRIYFGRAKHTPDDLRPLLSLLKKTNRNLDISLSDFSRLSSYSHKNSFINSSKQQVTVKFRYSDNIQAHMKYLKNYMVQKGKNEVIDKPKLFGNVSQEEYIKRIAREKEAVNKRGKKKKVTRSRHYKWILSPEMNLDEAVLKEYTKCFVKRLEQITGYKFVWQAAIHQDTAHSHVHLLINGVDMNGNIIKGFSKDVIQKYAREFSQDILTDMCGKRDAELKRKARSNRCYAERFTEFDEMLIKACEKDEKCNSTNYMGYINSKGISDLELQNRLDFLKSINLADMINGKYYLKKDFEQKLRNYGRYNTFRDAQSYVQNGYDMKLYTKDMGEIKGTIRKVYSMNDEDIWNNGIVLEDEETGAAYYVPSFNPVNKKVGDKIKVVIKSSEGNRRSQMKFEDIDKNKQDYNDRRWNPATNKNTDVDIDDDYSI